MKKAIVIGASSGIGRELARLLSMDGYEVGITGRRVKLLEELEGELPNKAYIKEMDVSRPEEAIAALEELIAEMGGLELIIINSGIGYVNPDLNWELVKETIAVNVTGFAAMTNAAAEFFRKQGSGHIVGISSISAVRGIGSTPAYSASKAFEANYLQGIRQRFAGFGVKVSIIQPGYIETDIIKGGKSFWVSPLDEGARQIYQAIKKQKYQAYVTRKWRFVAWFMKLMPEKFWNPKKVKNA